MSRRFIAVAALLAAFCAEASAEKIDTLRISEKYTTHIIFSSDIIYADLSNSRVVAAKIIEQNKNMLALKARESFTEFSSVSALESNGAMHTFIIAYDSDPSSLVIDMRPKEEPKYQSSTAQLISSVRESRGEAAPRASAPVRQSSPPPSSASTWKTGAAPLLQDVVRQRQHIFHIGCKEYGLEALIEDISSYNDVTYMVISLRNGTGISYDITDATFVIENKNAMNRKVRDDKPVFPRARQGKISVGPGEYSRIAYSFDKMTLSKDQVLKVYLYETNGMRNLVMTVDTRDINKARTSI